MEKRVKKEKTTLGYLASPYALYPAGAEHAFIDICIIAGHLIEAGVNVYSPIAHCHPIAVYTGMKLHNYELWMPLDKIMLDRCDTLIVAHMEGWQHSKGIAEEVEYFATSDKPVYDLDIDTLCMVRRADPKDAVNLNQLKMGEW